MSEKTEAPADVPPMTLRQYAAIHLRVPESGEEWLDAMIQAARLMDNQQAALSGTAVAPWFVITRTNL